MLLATVGQRYFLSTSHAVSYAAQEIAGGHMIAPDNNYQKVMSSMALSALEEDRQDI